MSLKNLIDDANNLLEDFENLPKEERWWVPFPMGVFGTLRKGRGNHRLMGVKNNEEPFEDWWGEKIKAKHLHWCKAFMSNHHPQGLTLHHEENSTGPFEIYFFDQDNWNKMIPRVENLEGFTPCFTWHRGYHRTLAWLHILPDDFENDSWDRISTWDNAHRKKLQIPKEDWHKFPKVPAWVYSNCVANNKSLENNENTIIWTGLEE